MKATKVHRCKECSVEETTAARLRRHIQIIHSTAWNRNITIDKQNSCVRGCGFSGSKLEVTNHQTTIHAMPKNSLPCTTATCNHCPYQAIGIDAGSKHHARHYVTSRLMSCPYEGCKGKDRGNRTGFKDASALAVHLLSVHEDEEAAVLAREAKFDVPWGQDIVVRSRFAAVNSSAVAATESAGTATQTPVVAPAASDTSAASPVETGIDNQKNSETGSQDTTDQTPNQGA